MGMRKVKTIYFSDFISASLSSPQSSSSRWRELLAAGIGLDVWKEIELKELIRGRLPRLLNEAVNEPLRGVTICGSPEM
jgi:hypothetical protein